MAIHLGRRLRRGLTKAERALAGSAFVGAFGSDSGFDYDTVRLIDGRFVPWQLAGYVVTPGNHIDWPGLPPCLASYAIPLAALFVHEMAHVWQYQHGANVLLRGSAMQCAHFLTFKRWNPYVLPLGVPFERLNLEQQAQYVSYQLFPDCVPTRQQRRTPY